MSNDQGSASSRTPTRGLYGWMTHTEIASSNPGATKSGVPRSSGGPSPPAFRQPPASITCSPTPFRAAVASDRPVPGVFMSALVIAATSATSVSSRIRCGTPANATKSHGLRGIPPSRSSASSGIRKTDTCRAFAKARSSGASSRPLAHSCTTSRTTRSGFRAPRGRGGESSRCMPTSPRSTLR